MNKLFTLCLVCTMCATYVAAQTDSLSATGNTCDTSDTNVLDQVVVRAYGQNGILLETPAAVHVIGKADLDQYNNTSILPAVNKIPGIRMEERSPGSYRFGIRGSSLQSPFGVRNIKVYYNDIPYTDPGGNTYLNQLGFYNFSSVEIIKGPGSSLYGAGTGGVLLISSMPQQWHPGATVSYTGGSYGLSSTAVEARIGDTAFRNVIRYQHLESDGYRQQAKTKKDVLSWDALMKRSNRSELSAHFLYGDLYYQTPGALTLKQYEADARQARPNAGANPGAIQSGAAIYQKTFLAGLTYTQHISSSWSDATTLYGLYSQQLNPNLRNYSRTSEPNFGGRTQFRYERPINNGRLQWLTGAEAQQGFAQNRTYQNVNGSPRYLQADQEIDNRQLTGFTQLQLQLRKWIFTGGVSVSKLQVQLAAISAAPYTAQDRTFNNQLSPRLAVLNRITEKVSVYASAARGFSPPTASELAPTGSAVNFNLDAQHAWNYEAGMRSFIGQRLFIEAGLYYLQLRQAIVQRRDSLGGDYYLNAGSTKQAGVEVYADYKLVRNRQGFIKACNLYASYTGNYFHYDEFVQAGSDFSGKQMPGVAPNTVAAGINVHSNTGIYLDVNYFYSDKIALDDGNTAYTHACNLLGAKAGYGKTFTRYTLNIFVGADNLLNEKYSLGNDINAVNGRYYNAAAPLNYFAGISVGYLK